MEARTTSPGGGLLGSSRRAPAWDGVRALARHIRPAGFVGLSVAAHVVLSAIMPAGPGSFSGKAGASSQVAVAITEAAPEPERETRPAPPPEPAAVPVQRGAPHDPTPEKRPDPEPAPSAVAAKPKSRGPEPNEPTKPSDLSKKKEPSTDPPAAGTPDTDEDENGAVAKEVSAEGEVQVAPSDGEGGGASDGQGEDGPEGRGDRGSAGGPDGSERAEGGGGDGHGGGVDLRGLVRAYMTRVARVLREGHDYPRAARRAGHEGTVQLAITIDPRGHIEDVHVARSSGHDTLDEAAVTSVRTRGKVPAPPPELHWRTRPVQLPIAYRLQ